MLSCEEIKNLKTYHTSLDLFSLESKLHVYYITSFLVAQMVQ